MIEYESTYKVKMELLKLLENQLEVEKSIKSFHEQGDIETAKILAERYE